MKGRARIARIRMNSPTEALRDIGLAAFVLAVGALFLYYCGEARCAQRDAMYIRLVLAVFGVPLFIGILYRCPIGILCIGSIVMNGFLPQDMRDFPVVNFAKLLGPASEPYPKPIVLGATLSIFILLAVASACFETSCNQRKSEA